MKKRYWLRREGESWQEVTPEQFVQAEREAGFYPKSGLGPFATDGFGANFLEGRVTYGENYGRDPDFLQAVRRASRKRKSQDESDNLFHKLASRFYQLLWPTKKKPISSG